MSRGVLKSKGGGKLSIHFCADEGTIETVFAQEFLLISSVFTEQSQICVTNANLAMLEAGRPVLVGQSDPLSQKYQERVDKLSQQNRVIKFCTDAGFLTVVDVGQCFMTKDTEEFSQFTEPVACREYILPRDKKII